jgi:hypothetical protein
MKFLEHFRRKSSEPDDPEIQRTREGEEPANEIAEKCSAEPKTRRPDQSEEAEELAGKKEEPCVDFVGTEG